MWNRFIKEKLLVCGLAVTVQPEYGAELRSQSSFFKVISND
jgi:hypothetical protein